MKESMMVKINREYDEGNQPAPHGVSLKRLVMQDFYSVKDNPPPVGALCIVYFPIGENTMTGKTSGVSAIAYKTENGWKMADTPGPLRGILGEVGPAYWCELVINHYSA